MHEKTDIAGYRLYKKEKKKTFKNDRFLYFPNLHYYKHNQNTLVTHQYLTLQPPFSHIKTAHKSTPNN